jgi:hypothetical protein
MKGKEAKMASLQVHIICITRKLGKIALSYLDTINKGLHTPRAEPKASPIAGGTMGKGFSPAKALRRPGIHRLLILCTSLRLGFVSL